MDAALLLARLALAAVFGVAGAAKLADRAGSEKAITDFGLPAALAPLLGRLLPGAELVVALLLLPAATAWWGAVGALALLVVFVAGIGVNLARGRRPDCHCFGQLHSQPVGWPTLARNATLAAVAGFVVWRGPARVGPSAFAWLGELSTGGVVALAAVLVAAGVIVVQGWLIAQLLQQQGRMLVRLDAMDAALAQRTVPAAPAPSALAAPAPAPVLQGRAVGAPAPAFVLPAVAGGTMSLAELLAPGRPLVLLFMDPNCGPCTALLPKVVEWRREHAGTLAFTIVSRGTPKENRKKFVEPGLPPVLLQEQQEVTEPYQAFGTPSAVLVRPDGRLGSHVAPGADAITALVARAAAEEPAPAAPAVQLPDLDGRRVALADFRDEETLVLFWNPGCGFCEQMLPELKAWEAGRGPGAPRLLVVSTGSPEANRAMGLASTVVLDDGFAVGRAFGAGGTPSAVLVDAEGRVASPVAVGAPAVLALAAPVEVGIEVSTH